MNIEENNQSSLLDARCSSSCTRAGLTIVLFSAFALAMLSPLATIKPFNALSTYISLRFDLRDTLDQLETDPCWKTLINKEGDQVSSWFLSKLLRFRCEPPPTDKPKLITPSALSKSQEEKRSHKHSKSLKPDNVPPAAPTGFGFSYEPWYFQRIADVLTQLGDGEFLTLARSYSPRFNITIYRWENLRLRMIADKSKVPGASGAWAPEKIKKDPSISREQLINSLTLEDVRNLSNYELLEIRDIEPFWKELSHFNLPSLGMPMNIFSAADFVGLGLMFSLAYFWLFQKEAKLSKNYPAPGTLFGVFNRSFISRNMFTLFVALPAIASTLLAINTFPLSYSSIVFAVLIVGLSIMIAYNWTHVTKAVHIR